MQINHILNLHNSYLKIAKVWFSCKRCIGFFVVVVVYIKKTSRQKLNIMTNIVYKGCIFRTLGKNKVVIQCKVTKRTFLYDKVVFKKFQTLQFFFFTISTTLQWDYPKAHRTTHQAPQADSYLIEHKKYKFHLLFEVLICNFPVKEVKRNYKPTLCFVIKIS